MLPQRSTWSGLLLSAAVCTAGVLGTTTTMWAQAAPATAPAADAKLQTLADDFLHYSLVNQAELAKANAEALLASTAPPQEVLKAFEDASNGRNFRDVIIQAQRREGMKEIATKLLERVDEGARVVARDPMRIRAEVDRLANGPRAYQNAADRLRAAGQYGAPIYLEYLQNSAKKELHPYIIRIMADIGRPLVTPLVEELRVSDPVLRIELINVLGQIGYPQALPALRAMQMDSNTNPETQNAIAGAIAMIDRTGQAGKMSAAELYLRGAQNYYNKTSSYQPQNPAEKTNPIWIFDQGLNNVQAMQVPTEIWNSVMAVRMAEATLKIDSGNADAISLWLAADMRREIQLPAGATDPSRGAKSAEAALYMLAAGPIYVNPVLAKALEANDSALALKAIDALEATGGVAGLVSGNDSPLVKALANQDRSVRFRAAFALARANPPSQFPSYFRVVPVLAEAVNSTGAPTALLVVHNDNQRNALTDALRSGSSHFTVYAGNTLTAALTAAQKAPSIDVVIVPEEEMGGVADIAHNDIRMAGVPVLVTTAAANVGGVQARISEMKGYAAIDEKADEPAIAAALSRARGDVGSVPVSAENAAQFAATSLDLLGKLAADHHSIYAVSEAVPTLVDTLKDKRPEIATGAAKVLGALNSPDGERALAATALSADTDAAMRVVLFEQLAESAKRTTNVLDGSVVNGIIKVVSADADPKVRKAAAMALGALNVPSNQASALILQQAR